MQQGSNPLNGSLFPELLEAKEANGGGSPGSEPGIRQEVMNVLVAQLLQERGTIAAPERIIKNPKGSRRMPDVLVDFQGLRLIIEGEYDSRTAKDKASQSALNRVEEGIAHIAMALIYPASLRTLSANIARLKASLAESTLEYAIITESEAAQSQPAFPELSEMESAVIPFERGNLDGLEGALRRAYERLIEDRVLERAIDTLNNGIGTFLSCLKPQTAVTSRFASILEVRELPTKAKTTGTGEQEA